MRLEETNAEEVEVRLESECMVPLRDRPIAFLAANVSWLIRRVSTVRTARQSVVFGSANKEAHE